MALYRVKKQWDGVAELLVTFFGLNSKQKAISFAFGYKRAIEDINGTRFCSPINQFRDGWCWWEHGNHENRIEVIDEQGVVTVG